MKTILKSIVSRELTFGDLFALYSPAIVLKVHLYIYGKIKDIKA